MLTQNKNQAGITLIEIVLSIAIIAVLSALAMPISISLMAKNNIDTAAAHIVQSIRRAQLLSSSGTYDSSWGISIQNNQLTLFRGSAYVSRDVGYDEITALSSGISISGTQELIFQKITGDLVQSATITIQQNNETETLSINTKGLVTY